MNVLGNSKRAKLKVYPRFRVSPKATGSIICAIQQNFPSQVLRSSPLYYSPMSSLQDSEIDTQLELPRRISISKPVKFIGVGGVGSVLVRRLMDCLASHVEDVYIDADLDALSQYKDRLTVPLRQADGEIASPVEARSAADAAHSLISEALAGAEMVFIVGALGGNTGSGATNVVASIAKKLGILTLCVVTLPHEDNPPFPLHGASNAANAAYGLDALSISVDSLVVTREYRRSELEESVFKEARDKVLSDLQPKYETNEYFQSHEFFLNKVHEDLQVFIAAVTELVVEGFHCIDIEDLRMVLARRGTAAISIGTAIGDTRSETAVTRAANGLSGDFQICDAGAVFVVITCSKDIPPIGEQKRAINLLRLMLKPEADLVYGWICDPTLGESMRITLFATGGPVADLAASQAKDHVPLPTAN